MNRSGFVLTLLLTLGALTTFAAELTNSLELANSLELTEAPEPLVDWYQIELIVFSHVIDPNHQMEIWPQHHAPAIADPLELKELWPLLDYSALPTEERLDDWVIVNTFPVSLPLLTGTVAEALTPERPDIAIVPFIQLPQKHQTLQKVRKRLTRSLGEARILTSMAWRQQAPDAKHPIKVRVFGGLDYAAVFAEREALLQPQLSPFLEEALRESPYPPHDPVWQLDGSFSIVKSRFLHIDIDVVFLLEKQNDELGDPHQAKSERTNAQVSVREHLHAYPLQQKRRILSKELHYIDHPLMGVIILVEPFNGLEDK